MNTPTLAHARAAKQKLAQRLADVEEVVGVGITKVNGQYGVKVNLQQSLRDPTMIPDAIDGVPVHLDIIGTIRVRSTP